MNNFVNSPQSIDCTVLPETRIYVKQIHGLVGIPGLGSRHCVSLAIVPGGRKGRAIDAQGVVLLYLVHAADARIRDGCAGPGKKERLSRVPFTTEVEIQIGDLSIRSSSVINISLNGLRLETEQSVAGEGSPCTIRIILMAFDHHVVIEAQGCVARTGPGYVAVEFAELDPDSYLHLRQLIINADDPVRAEEEFDAHWGIRRPPP